MDNSVGIKFTGKHPLLVNPNISGFGTGVVHEQDLTVIGGSIHDNLRGIESRGGPLSVMGTHLNNILADIVDNTSRDVIHKVARDVLSYTGTPQKRHGPQAYFGRKVNPMNTEYDRLAREILRGRKNSQEDEYKEKALLYKMKQYSFDLLKESGRNALISGVSGLLKALFWFTVGIALFRSGLL